MTSHCVTTCSNTSWTYLNILQSQNIQSFIGWNVKVNSQEFPYQKWKPTKVGKENSEKSQLEELGNIPIFHFLQAHPTKTCKSSPTTLNYTLMLLISLRWWPTSAPIKLQLLHNTPQNNYTRRASYVQALESNRIWIISRCNWLTEAPYATHTLAKLDAKSRHKRKATNSRRATCKFSFRWNQLQLSRIALCKEKIKSVW